MVKKSFVIILSILLIALLSLLPTVAAQKSTGEIRVVLNGAELSFDSAPILQNDRTFVPMRAIFEALGMTVEWTAETQSILARDENITLRLRVDETSVTKETPQGTETIETDVAPFIKEDRTMVPLRLITEATGCFVSWDPPTHTVVIVSQEFPENVGRLYYEDGETVLYLGEIRNSLPNGKGTYFYENGSVLCIGEFKDGEMNGACTVFGINTVESGFYQNGQPQ